MSATLYMYVERGGGREGEVRAEGRGKGREGRERWREEAQMDPGFF